MPPRSVRVVCIFLLISPNVRKVIHSGKILVILFDKSIKLWYINVLITPIRTILVPTGIKSWVSKPPFCRCYFYAFKVVKSILKTKNTIHFEKYLFTAA